MSMSMEDWQMDDMRCAAAARGTLAETRYDHERARRYVISQITDDDAAANEVWAQLGNCPDCLAGFGLTLGSIFTGVLVGGFGRDNARAVAQMKLDEVLACPDLLNPGK